MVRSIFAAATLLVAGLAGFAAAQSYEDFELETTVGLTYAGPMSSLGNTFGTLDEAKSVCTGLDNCIAVIYRE